MGKCAFSAAAAAISFSLAGTVAVVAEPAATRPVNQREDVRIAAPPRAEQIEPIVVEPVKRVKPKAPVIIENDGAGGSGSKKSAKIVGDKPNCDKGFKPDSQGKSCVRIADSAPLRKKKR